MTEDTSPPTGRLYIHVRNWERFQGRRASTGQPWFAVHTSLFDDADFLALSPANRCLFLGILCDTKRLGNGWVRADLRSLRVRHNVSRAQLEPLIHAGFIDLSGTRGGHDVNPTGSLQDKTEEEKPLKVSPSSSVSSKGAPTTADAAVAPPNGKPQPPNAANWTEEAETKWRQDLAAWATKEGIL